jgi:CAAX protease family protein
MRAFGLFLATIALTLLLAAALAYPVYALTAPHVPGLEFHRLASRLWQVLMLAGVVWLARRLRLRDRADYGYGTPRPRWLAEACAGLGLGVATMLLVTAAMLLLGVRTPLPAVDAARVVHVLLSGLASGLAVGFLEETFFRGVLQGAVRRELGDKPLAIVAAVALVAVLYASLHFLARISIPASAVGPLSGFRLLAAAGANFMSFGTIADAFWSLTAVGALLGLAREYTGSIALGVGLHAGWVWVMRATVGLTAAPPASPRAWLVSRSDGYTGWLVLAFTIAFLLVAVPALRTYRRQQRS